MKELENLLTRSLIGMGSERYDNDIHASNLVDFCPRAYCLSQEQGKLYNSKGRTFNPSLALTFHIGDAIHGIAKRIFEHAGILVANEHKVTVNWKDKVKVTGAWDDIIKHHPDDTDNFSIVDVKSISSTRFNGIKTTALQEHVQQVRVYMWQANKLGLAKINQKEAYILYIPKEMTGDPFKLVKVPWSASYEAEIESSLDIIVAYLEDRVLPERLCGTPTNFLAKSCSMCSSCFNRVEDSIILGGEDVSTEKKPAKRKSKPKGDGETHSREPKYRHSGRRRSIPQ